MIADSFPRAAKGATERDAAAETSIPGVRTLPWPPVALGLILLLAAALNLWQLDRLGYSNPYYAAAVKSMLLSWHNFFFNAFDPGGFVTIDKPPLGFWFQVASAKLFGYSGVSLLLPQALAGVGSVALLYLLVRRVFGIPAGLLAALFLALTPVAVVDNRNNTIDSTLVLFLLLGAWAVSKAAESGKLRWLMLCAVFVGLGFNIKMLEAYLVVPAFGVLYLLGTRLRWRTRLAHLVLAGVVMLSLSLSWAVAVDLTPASQRPWVDSTQTNSELDLAIGYNGLQRLLGRGSPRAVATGAAAATRAASVRRAIATTSAPARGVTAIGGGGGGGGGLFNNGAAGPLRLFNGTLGGQASWLLPLALIGVLLAAARRVRFPLDRRQQAVLLWGTWLLTVGAFFSVAGFFHSYYLVTLAPAVAALASIGLVSLAREYLAPTAAWRAWLLPAGLAVAAAAQVAILANFPGWSNWITPPVALLTAGAVIALVVMRWRPAPKPALWKASLVAGLVALLIAPTAWTIDSVRASNGGQIPSAGPTASSGGNGPGGAFAGGISGGAPAGPPGQGGFGGGVPGGGHLGFTVPASGTVGAGAGFPGGAGRAGGFGGFGRRGGNAGGGPGGESVNTGLLSYLLKHQGTTTYLLAVNNSMSAAPYIIQTGKPVMSLGGFSGSDPIVTATQFKALVKNNTVRFVLAGGGGGGGGSGGPDSGSSVTSWVQQSCTAVPGSAWHSSSTASGWSRQQLYDCSNVAFTAK